MAKITEDITEALRQQDRPLEIRDAAGQIYYVLTDQQLHRYVYDDSELTPDEMIAAASAGIEDELVGDNTEANGADNPGPAS